MGAFDGELYALGYRFYEVKEPEPEPKRIQYPELHLAKQPCPGCCHTEVCVNSWCSAHPNYAVQGEVK